MKEENEAVRITVVIPSLEVVAFVVVGFVVLVDQPVVVSVDIVVVISFVVVVE